MNLTEWAVRYERRADPTMDNPSGIITATQVVRDEATARQAVKNRAPISGTGHRVVSRTVSEWRD